MKKNLLFVFLMLFLIFQLPVNTYAIDASSVIGKRVQVGDNCYAYVEDLEIENTHCISMDMEIYMKNPHYQKKQK